jgi:hypothetical protein
MQFINPQGEYPTFYGEIQQAFPEWQPGDTVPEGWTEVFSTTPPEHDYLNETIIELEPAEIDGVMKQQWGTRPLTAEEIERREAPASAKAKLAALGLTDLEIQALANGLVR